jgi:hypothetical protein
MATNEGLMLSQLLARRGPLGPTLAVEIAIKIAYLLAAANRTSALGRLKTDAIQLTGDGRVVVHPTTAAPNTEPADPYAPPEIARGDTPGPTADVFAVGVVLLEMLTGRTRMTSETLDVVPEDLDPVLQCALAPDPADRYADTRALARVLDAWARARVDVRTARAYPVTTPLAVGGRRRFGSTGRSDPAPRSGSAAPLRNELPEKLASNPSDGVRRTPATDRTSWRAVDPSERFPSDAAPGLVPNPADDPRGERGLRTLLVAVVGIVLVAVLMLIAALAMAPPPHGTAGAPPPGHLVAVVGPCPPIPATCTHETRPSGRPEGLLLLLRSQMGDGAYRAERRPVLPEFVRVAIASPTNAAGAAATIVNGRGAPARYNPAARPRDPAATSCNVPSG